MVDFFLIMPILTSSRPWLRSILISLVTGPLVLSSAWIIWAA